MKQLFMKKCDSILASDTAHSSKELITLLEGINKIKDIPCIIVHGQYDIVCPIRQAHDLHKVYDHSELIIAKDSGHSLLEPTISKEILNIFDNVIE